MGKSTSDKSLKLETYITRRKLNPNKEDNEKKKRKDSFRKVSLILQKCETSRTPEDKRVLESCSEIARAISKRKARTQLYKERAVEKEDAIEVIERKTERLAQIISRAKHLVCYTGAGISTSAQIPDYRGSQGIWTLLQQGKEIGQHDLSLADPTYTHMALYELHRRKMLRFVVSQNCDGLHLRAGLPKASISEVHGNMYIEVCKNCKPNVEYWRLFDTTELTARFYHKTNRRCHLCNKPLNDTIVHFGERGNLKWPLNWAGACAHSEKADVILCLGSSLKVLKKYSWLWQMDRPLKKRAKICIINLQWTPKDKLSTLKINGKCDEVMQLVMKYLNINVPEYTRERDPIFSHASLLCTEELHTVSQPMLKKAMKKEEDEESQEAGSEDNENENELEASTTSENDSRSGGENDSMTSNSPSKRSPFNQGLRPNGEMKRKSVTPIKKPIPSPLKMSPVKSVPFVKTSLNSKHLLLAAAERSSESEDDETETANNCNNDLKCDLNIDASAMKHGVKVASNSNVKTETVKGSSTYDSDKNIVKKLNCKVTKNPPPENDEYNSQTRSAVNNVKENIEGKPPFNNASKNGFLGNCIPVNPECTDIFGHKGCEKQCIPNADSLTPVQYQKTPFYNTHLKGQHQTEITKVGSIQEGNLKPIKHEHSMNIRRDHLEPVDRKIDTHTPHMANSISSKIVGNSLQKFNCDSFKKTSIIGTGLIGPQQQHLNRIAATTMDSTVTGALTHAFRRLQTRPENFKVHSNIVKGLNQRQLFELNPLNLSQLANSEEYYRNFFEYCQAVEQKLPFWYDVGYAYSGLHSIIQPPPPEIDLWSSMIVPIFNMNKNEAECEFCFENYAEFKCQFYRKFNPEFAIKKYRSGNLVVCECCDYTDDEEEDTENLDTSEFDANTENIKQCEKRAKLDMQILREPVKIQAGWYGKGYKKNFRRRRR